MVLISAWRFRIFVIVVKQHAYCRRMGIVMLAGPVSPEKGAQKYQRDEYTAADQKEYRTHDL